MLDNYIQGFEEARQFIQHHYDALPMQNNANRFKHGNRCPQGEYWVQPPGKKGFCRAIGKRKGGMSNPQPMQVQKKKSRKMNNEIASKLGYVAAGTMLTGAIGAGLVASHVAGAMPYQQKRQMKARQEMMERTEKRNQTIRQGQKDLDNLLN